MAYQADEAPTLGQDQLEVYADGMRRHGVPFDERSAPGLSDDQMESAIAPLGLLLPDEARTWWRWRNGQVDRLDGLFCPGFRPLSIQEAVEHYRFMRRIAKDTAEPGLATRETAEELWAPQWFPLASRRRR
jgi:hypothetical protein